MNKQLKQALSEAFEAPMPRRKTTFLNQLRGTRTTYKEFIVSQISYIRKRIWFFSMMTSSFMILLVISNFSDILWILSATIPFLALLSMVELSRSTSNDMEELELSCRYTLSQVVMSRALILGISNFILLMASVVCIYLVNQYSLISNVLYIFTPYLLTCALSLFVFNFHMTKNSVSSSAIVACFVSGSHNYLFLTNSIYVMPQYQWIWGFLCLISLGLLLNQAQKYLKNTEDLQWNLSLTD